LIWGPNWAHFDRDVYERHIFRELFIRFDY
jgi:hypothetical protein